MKNEKRPRRQIFVFSDEEGKMSPEALLLLWVIAEILIVSPFIIAGFFH